MLSTGVTVAKDVKCKVYPKNYCSGKALFLLIYMIEVSNFHVYDFFAIFVVEPAAPRHKELIKTRRDNETNGFCERRKNDRMLVMIVILQIVELLNSDYE